MGGLGSGRHEYAETPTVEECRSLDADTLKEVTRDPDAESVVWWGEREDPDAALAVLAEGDAGLDDETRPARLRLRYTVTRPEDDESREYDYSIPLEYTECNFGGYRPWFRCPGCRARRGKLYLPPGHERYLCRECYDLGYTSSRTSGDRVKQAELRYRRAFAKADKHDRRPHPNGSPHLPERPKGMHRDTFERLVEDVHTASEEFHDRLLEYERELLARYQSE